MPRTRRFQGPLIPLNIDGTDAACTRDIGLLQLSLRRRLLANLRSGPVHDSRLRLSAAVCLEELDSGRVRLEKLQSIIQACAYGIHDLSRVEVAPATALPRFNMAFELGLDIAASMFGSGRLKRKRYLILDSEPHRYKQSISDISGLDIQCHRHNPDAAITAVRNWLRAVSRRSDTPGPIELRRRYQTFVAS